MRSARALITIVVLLTAAACGEPGDGGVDVEPRSGAWTFMGSDPVDDTCMLENLYVDSPGTFTLTNNGDGTFTIDDTQNVFDCTIDGSSFTCPTRLTGSEDLGAAAGLDAVANYNVSVSGSFSSDAAMSGRQQVEIDCVGADCAAVEAVAMVTTPCGWAQDFTATAQ